MTTLTQIYDRLGRAASTIDSLYSVAKSAGHAEAASSILTALATVRQSQKFLHGRLPDDQFSTRETPPLLRGPNNRRLRANAQGAYLLVSGRWKAKAQHQGVSHHLGYYDTKEEAQAAYKGFWENLKKENRV